MVESVGRKLQQARLARNLEIEDVAERTKIRPDRIIDLEADEYSHFPNLTYAKSFLAKYARFLGIDIQAELDKFQISSAISMGEYQYLSSIPAQNQCKSRWTQRIAKRISSSSSRGGGACFNRAGRSAGFFLSGTQHPKGGRNEFCRPRPTKQIRWRPCRPKRPMPRRRTLSRSSLWPHKLRLRKAARFPLHLPPRHRK